MQCQQDKLHSQLVKATAVFLFCLSEKNQNSGYTRLKKKEDSFLVNKEILVVRFQQFNILKPQYILLQKREEV